MNGKRKSGSAPGRRPGPGRPEGASFTRPNILDAAEATFAERGFAGTSLREISSRARVTQGLITYYFGTKEALFKEVFLRRGRDIAARRIAAIDALLAGGKRFTLPEVVRAYLWPALEMRRTRSGQAFIRLQARMHTEPTRFAEQLRHDVYDQTSRRFVKAIRIAAPHVSERAAYWRMILTVGAYLYAHSDAHRLERISNGRCDPDDLDQMLEQVTAFVVGGIVAPDVGAGRRRAARQRVG